MKKFLNIALLAAVVALTAVSCGKFEEGPSFSLASVKGRLTGKWKADKATETTNGVSTDITAAMAGQTVEFLKDGTGTLAATFAGGSISFPITWEVKDDVILAITFNDGTSNQTDESTILRLTKKELVYEEVDSLTTTRYEMVPAE